MDKKIFITGDTHGDLSLIRFQKAKKLNPDYLIVTGDFGYLYDNSKGEINALNQLEKMPYTILWVDGNHENFDLLKNYPEVKYKGGVAQQIRKNIFRLKRGEIYTIEGKTFFTFGGAKSIDRMFRTLNKSYWLEECPTDEEKEYGLNNLCKVNNKVDYIITHTCALDTLYEIIPYPEQDDLSNYLQHIKDNVIFDKWYFGHLHFDMNVNGKEYCLYRNIVEI